MSEQAASGRQSNVANQLERCLNAAAALKESLAAERDALSGRDPAHIATAVGEKQLRLAELAKMLAANRSIFRSAEATGSGAGDFPGERWRQFLALAAECERLNSGNGAAIRLRQHQIERGIALLRGTDTATDVYGPSGARSATAPGRTLTEA